MNYEWIVHRSTQSADLIINLYRQDICDVILKKTKVSANSETGTKEYNVRLVNGINKYLKLSK